MRNAENGSLFPADTGNQQLVSYHSIGDEPVLQAYELINNRCEGDAPVLFRRQQMPCTNSSGHLGFLEEHDQHGYPLIHSLEVR